MVYIEVYGLEITFVKLSKYLHTLWEHFIFKYEDLHY